MSRILDIEVLNLILRKVCRYWIQYLRKFLASGKSRPDKCNIDGIEPAPLRQLFLNGLYLCTTGRDELGDPINVASVIGLQTVQTQCSLIVCLHDSVHSHSATIYIWSSD